MLETLPCSFDDLKEWRDYMEYRKKSQQFSDYTVQVGKRMFMRRSIDIFEGVSKNVMIIECSNITDSIAVALPIDIQALSIRGCSDLKGSLCDSISAIEDTTLLLESCDGIEILVVAQSSLEYNTLKRLQHLDLGLLRNLCGLVIEEVGIVTTTTFLSNLKIIDMVGCDRVKRLFPSNLLPNLQNLQEIRVRFCDAMEEIFATTTEENEGDDVSISTAPTHSLSNLKSIRIKVCKKLQTLFPLSLLPNLQNLQAIDVYNSRGMEEIFAADRGDGEEDEQVGGINLPNLIRMELEDLPELRSIYEGAIICHSLLQINLVHCPKIKRLTFPLPQLFLQSFRIYPQEWWHSVQWASTNSKANLQYICEATNKSVWVDL